MWIELIMYFTVVIDSPLMQQPQSAQTSQKTNKKKRIEYDELLNDERSKNICNLFRESRVASFAKISVIFPVDEYNARADAAIFRRIKTKQKLKFWNRNHSKASTLLPSDKENNKTQASRAAPKRRCNNETTRNFLKQNNNK